MKGTLILSILATILVCTFAQETGVTEDLTDATQTETDEPATSTAAATSSTPKPAFECPANGIYPDPVRCEYYYSCLNGVANHMKCSEDFLYDTKNTGCNYPEATECEDRERPEGYPDVTTIGPGSSTQAPPFQCPPGVNANYPDMSNCAAYWQCYQGLAYYFVCAMPLLYDDNLQVCNFPGSVNCGLRPKP